jgi:hypothetical protein
MNAFKSSKVFLLLAALTTVLACISIAMRVKVENSNNQYAIAADSDSIESLAASEGLTIEEAIPRLKQQGLNAIVLQEQTVGELISEGRVELIGMTLQPSANISDRGQVKSLAFADDATVDRVVQGLTIRFGDLVKSSRPRDRKLALPPVDTASLRGTAIGLDPRIADIAKKNGLMIIARCSNPSGITSKAVGQTLTWANRLGATIFLAQGEQVLGRRDAIETTANTLTSLKMLYASPEFAKLGGDVDMLERIPGSVIRLHSAQAAELDKLSVGAAVERYRKAGKERNMRVLLVRPLSNASDAPLTSLGEFIGSIQSALAKEGLSVGTPVPYKAPGVPSFLRILIGLAGGACLFWTGIQVLRGQYKVHASLVLALLTILGSATNGKGLQIAALSLSMVFPVAAYLWLMRTKPNVWVGFFGISLLSMVGGLCVAGLLNGIDYYIRAETFGGVKASVFLPIFVIGIACFAHLNNFRGALKEPITWGAAATGVLILGGLGLMVMRTGNDNPNAVSGGELAFRGLLEQLLPVRPRTKSFLVGFPALFIALSLLARVRYQPVRLGKLSGWTALLVMVGGIGLTDVVNTFCHLHTPVMTSLFRNIEGIVLGLVIGVVIWTLLHKVLEKHLLETEPQAGEATLG